MEIIRNWNFSSVISNENYHDLLENVNSTFKTAIDKCIKGKTKIGLNISGGYDSRQLLGYLIKNKINFNGYNYGPSDSLDVIVAKELSSKHKFNLFFKEWFDIKFYIEILDKCMEPTDYMLAFHHFHPFNILDNQKKEDVILYGHFLDFHSQAWKYEKKYEKLNSNLAVSTIANDFSKAGHFSVLNEDVEKKLINKKYKSLFKERL